MGRPTSTVSMPMAGRCRYFARVSGPDEARIIHCCRAGVGLRFRRALCYQAPIDRSLQRDSESLLGRLVMSGEEPLEPCCKDMAAALAFETGRHFFVEDGTLRLLVAHT